MSGEVFGIRCEFGPINKHVPFTELSLPPGGLDNIQYSKDGDNTSDVKGKIVLCKRGGGKFADKTKRAQNAGAVGVLFWNHLNEKEIMSVSGKGGEDLRIPSIFINDPEIGKRLSELLADKTKNDPITASFSLKTGWKDASDLCRRALLIRQMSRLEENYLDEYLTDHNLPFEK
eukprot:UN25495